MFMLTPWNISTYLIGNSGGTKLQQEFTKKKQRIHKEEAKNSQQRNKEFTKKKQRIHKEETKNSQRRNKEFTKNSQRIHKEETKKKQRKKKQRRIKTIEAVKRKFFMLITCLSLDWLWWLWFKLWMLLGKLYLNQFKSNWRFLFCIITLMSES